MARIGTPRAPARSARRPVIIELVGLPGAGKTTIAHAVVEELEALGHRVAGRRALGNRGGRDVIGIGLHYLRHPRALWTPLYAALATPPVSRVRIVHALRLADWSYRLGMARIEQYDVVVLDQGMLQEGWSVSLASSRPALRSIRAAFRGTVRSVGAIAVVHIDLSPDAAHRRLAARATRGSRFDTAVPGQARRLLEASAPHLLHLIENTLTECGLPHLRIDARNPVAQTTREVVSFVQSLMPPPSALSDTAAVPAVGTRTARILESGVAP